MRAHVMVSAVVVRRTTFSLGCWHQLEPHTFGSPFSRYILDEYTGAG